MNSPYELDININIINLEHNYKKHNLHSPSSNSSSNNSIKCYKPISKKQKVYKQPYNITTNTKRAKVY